MVQRVPGRGNRATTVPRRKTEDPGIARRRELLEIASDVFARRGYEAPSVAELAAAFGLQKATFYHYFESKEVLLQAVLRSGIEQIYAEAVKVMAEHEEPTERLRALLACHARHVEREGSRVVVYLVERHVLSPEFQKEYVPLRRQYDALFVETIEEGQRQGLIREGDPLVMAYGLIGMYNWLVQWYQPSGARTIQQIHEVLSEMTFLGLLRPGASPTGSIYTLCDAD